MTQLTLMALTVSLVQANSAQLPPNIVFIVADDLGYGDLGCYGNTAVSTPNLDRMAAEGIRFTEFYANGPMCSPTRAALLTGRYQQRVGVGSMQGHLFPDEITLGARLRDAGYATGYFGKWHVSGPLNDESLRQRMPVDFGFDEFRGFMTGFIDFQNYLDGRGLLDWWHNRELVTDDEGYATHILTRHTLDFIRENHAAKRPFFAVLAIPDIHAPMRHSGQFTVARRIRISSLSPSKATIRVKLKSPSASRTALRRSGIPTTRPAKGSWASATKTGAPLCHWTSSPMMPSAWYSL